EPYFFKANFANKTGDKQRKAKLLEEELKVNQWQQCTTFRDDIDNDSVSQIMDKRLVSTRISSLEDLTLFELVKFMQSRNTGCEHCAIKPYVDHFHYVIDEAVIINPLESLPELLELTCHGCKGVLKVAQKVCEICNVATYCGKWCQMNDWERHCTECKTISSNSK
ncbi:hypothetical protein B4U80_14318, partial [Leptotrombidium deliense]